MSQQKKTAKKRARKQVRDEGIEAALEGLYERGKRLTVLKRDMSAADREKFQQRQAQVGLASNILGMTAGGAALVTAAKNPALRPSKADEKTAGPVSRRVMGKIKSAKGKKALIVGGAAGALGLQAANLGGDVVANRVLARESGVGKAMSDKQKTAAQYGAGAAVGGALGGVGGALYQRKLGRLMSEFASPNAKGPIRNANDLERMNPVEAIDMRRNFGPQWKKIFDQDMGVTPAGTNRRAGMKFSEARRVMGTRTAAELKAKGVAESAKVKARSGKMRLVRTGARGGTGALIGGALGAVSGLTTVNEMRKSIEQSAISKSDPVVVSGHGVNIEKMSTRTKAGIVAGVVGGGAIAGGLKMQRDRKEKKRLEEENARLKSVAKRNFNAEADRQRRLGLYTGAGLGAGLVLGDAARRRAPLKTVELKDGSRRKVIDLPKGRRGKLTLAALAGGAALSAGGGVAAYRRGISERNNAYL